MRIGEDFHPGSVFYLPVVVLTFALSLTLSGCGGESGSSLAKSSPTPVFDSAPLSQHAPASIAKKPASDTALASALSDGVVHSKDPAAASRSELSSADYAIDNRHQRRRRGVGVAGPDFALSVTPPQLLLPAGNRSNPLSIAIAGRNGFGDAVTISFSTLPGGYSSQPTAPFTVAAGDNQLVTFSAPANAPLTSFTLEVDAVSGSIIRTAQVQVILMRTTTFDDGAGMLYLETKTLTDTARIGQSKSWGGSIVEASLNGTDYVNNDDPGRQIQVSLWDTNTSWYNPIEAGDHDYQGSPLLAYALQPESVYTKTQPIQWTPEYFSGGYGAPVLGDAYIEKWISVVPGYSRVFKVHYKITHFGADWHAEAPQELPVVYVNPNVSTFIYYSGDAPWTNGALSQFTMPWGCCAPLHTPEKWGAYVDDSNTGLAVYTPMQFPSSKGFNAGSTLQFTPLCPFTWDTGAVLEFDTYVLMGPVDESRKAIYALHDQQPDITQLPPFGYLDAPASGDTLTGTATIQGWAWAVSSLTSVDVYADGVRVGSAALGLPRTDISSVFAGAPADLGYKYALDSTKLSNGSHTLIVKATDANGHVATFRAAQVIVIN